MANIYRDGFKLPSILEALRRSYLIGYQRESVQAYHDAMELEMVIMPKKERKKLVARGMFRGF